MALSLPLVVYLNCVEDCSAEQRELASVAVVEHVALTDIAKGRIEAATVVVVHSLAFLPRNAQRRLSPAQLILCLGSADKQVSHQFCIRCAETLYLCPCDVLHAWVWACKTSTDQFIMQLWPLREMQLVWNGCHCNRFEHPSRF